MTSTPPDASLANASDRHAVVRSPGLTNRALAPILKVTRMRGRGIVISGECFSFSRSNWGGIRSLNAVWSPACGSSAHIRLVHRHE